MARGLHSLAVKGFGILGDVKVELSRLNVLVGPNGSGKSTLLRVIQFLGDASRSSVNQVIGGRAALEQLQTRVPSSDGPLETPKSIEIGVEAIVTSHAHEDALDEYQLTIHSIGIMTEGDATPGIRQHGFLHDEHFKFKRTKKQGRRIKLSAGRLFVFDDDKKEKVQHLDAGAFGLAVLPQLGPDQGGAEVRKIQELFTTFRVMDIDTKRAREPAEVDGPTSLLPDARNLASSLLFLDEHHPEEFQDLKADARAMIPGLSDIRFRKVGGSSEAVVVEVIDHGRSGATPLRDASFGTIRAIALLAMLYDPAPPLLSCIEEIDHGFHPYVFDRLVELLRKASARTQFIIATHSPALVNRLRPDELIVCERDPDTGLARIPAIGRDAVAKIYEAGGADGFRLGELWFSGSLGGVPR